MKGNSEPKSQKGTLESDGDPPRQEHGSRAEKGPEKAVK